MALHAASTHGYLRIPPTTPRSTPMFFYLTSLLSCPMNLSFSSRVLMSSIRNLGGCPCPRCKIPLSEVHLVGTKKDRSKRLILARKDDVDRQYAIHSARMGIYDPIARDFFAVDSAFVEHKLKPESLVPTSVSVLKCGLVFLLC